MNDIKKAINELNTSIDQVKSEDYKNLFTDISKILDGLNEKVEETMINQTALAENLNYLDDDISDIQEELFEEVSLEDLDEFEDEYKEVNCNSCGKPIYIESSALDENKEIPCPYCGENII